MREIKFRAWDPLSNPPRMMGWDEICDHTLESVSSSELVPMQYTGLKDRNGTEIYEGDILRWDGSTIGAVIFEHCEFVVGKGVNARALCAVKDPYELGLFIIGNIHENPELLENPND